VIPVAHDHALDAVEMGMAPFGPRGQGNSWLAGHSMRFYVSLIYDPESVQVAYIQPSRVVWIVRSPDCIDVVLFHEPYIFQHYIDGNCLPRGPVWNSWRFTPLSFTGTPFTRSLASHTSTLRNPKLHLRPMDCIS